MNFRYKGYNAEGRAVSGGMQGESREEVLERLTVSGISVTALQRVGTAVIAGGRQSMRKRARVADKAILLKQFAVSTRAGVNLMDTLGALHESSEVSEIRQGLAEIMLRVRQGGRLSEAFANCMPFFPGYVTALIGVGETSGQLAEVLEDAADQTEREERLRKEVRSALTYPMFLLGAVLLGVMFLLYTVVPTFGELVDGTDDLDALSKVVFSLGELANTHGVAFFVGVLSLGLVIYMLYRAQKKHIISALARIPVIGALIMTMEKALWARVHHMGLHHGVVLLQTTELAAMALPRASVLGEVVVGAMSKLRRGERLDKIYEESGLFTPVETGLLGAGANTGKLDEIFGYMAQRYEQEVSDNLKRLMALLEPVSIIFVTAILGVVMVAIFSALLGVYEAVS